MIEGSGAGSIPLTSGSGSRRPKNIWIRWIRIRIQIRIRNTASTVFPFSLTVDNLCEIALSRGVRVQVGPKGVPNELDEGSVALLPYPLLVGAAQVEGLEVGPGRVLLPQRQHQV